MKMEATISTGFSSEALRRTLAEVERDEAEAISLLVGLLDKVRETSITTLWKAFRRLFFSGNIGRPTLSCPTY